MCVLRGERIKVNLSYMIDHALSVFKLIVILGIHHLNEINYKFLFSCIYIPCKNILQTRKKLYVIRGQVRPTESESERPIFPLLPEIAKGPEFLTFDLCSISQN